MKSIASTCAIAGLAMLLVACSTPKAALDQGNATASLVAAFDLELAAYRKAAARVAASRIAGIQRQETLLAELDEVNQWNLRTARLAGLGEFEDRRNSLVTLARSREQDEVATRQRLDELEARLKVLVKPLPSSSAKLAALQSALAELGTELPAEDRLKLVVDAVQTVRDEVKKNRDAATKIQAKEGAAPAPTSPVAP
jgi:hypothetical protein